MPVVQLNGVTINHESAGSGPAMVFLHPNPFDHTLWRHQMAHFQLWFKVIAIDLRGYGRSARPDDCAIGAMSDDVAGILDHLQIGAAIVAGLSVGGSVAQEFAASHPGRVTALIAAGCSASGPEIAAFMDERIRGYASGNVAEYYAQHMRDLAAPGFFDTAVGAYLMETFMERAGSLRRESLVAMFTGIKAWSVAERLHRIDVPALYIAGQHDPALATTRAASLKVRGAVFHEIPGTGHICALEAPGAFDRLVLDFLRAHRLLPAPNR